MADEKFEKFENCFITDSTDLENREYEEFCLADLARVAGIVKRCWTAAIASQREPMKCGHPTACLVLTDCDEGCQKKGCVGPIEFCTACEAEAAAYAKGASDSLRKFRDAHNLGSEGDADVGSNFSERKLDEMIAALPIPAAQPRDLGRLWELENRLREIASTLESGYQHEHGHKGAAARDKAKAYIYGADELAAILKETEVSR